MVTSHVICLCGTLISAQNHDHMGAFLKWGVPLVFPKYLLHVHGFSLTKTKHFGIPPWRAGTPHITIPPQKKHGITPKIHPTRSITWSDVKSYHVHQKHENTILPRHKPWCWYIYLQNWVIFGVNVGKYSSTMEHLGMWKNREKPCLADPFETQTTSPPHPEKNKNGRVARTTKPWTCIPSAGPVGGRHPLLFPAPEITQKNRKRMVPPSYKWLFKPHYNHRVISTINHKKNHGEATWCHLYLNWTLSTGGPILLRSFPWSFPRTWQRWHVKICRPGKGRLRERGSVSMFQNTVCGGTTRLVQWCSVFKNIFRSWRVRLVLS